MADQGRPLTTDELTALQQYLEAQAQAGAKPPVGSPAGFLGAAGAGGQVPAPQNAPNAQPISVPMVNDIIHQLARMGLHGVLSGAGGALGTLGGPAAPVTVPLGLAGGDLAASFMEPHISMNGQPMGQPTPGEMAMSAGAAGIIPAALGAGGRAAAVEGRVPVAAYNEAVAAGRPNLGAGTFKTVMGNAEEQIDNLAQQFRSMMEDSAQHPATITKDAIIDRLDAQGVMVDASKMASALRQSLRSRIGRGVPPQTIENIQGALDEYATKLEQFAQQHGQTHIAPGGAQTHYIPIRAAQDTLRILDDQLAAKFSATSASDTIESGVLKKVRTQWSDAILDSIPNKADQRLISGLNDQISAALTSKEKLLSQFGEFTAEQKIRSIMDPDHVALRRAISNFDDSYGTNFLAQAKQLAAKAKWNPSDWRAAGAWDRLFVRYLFRPAAKGAAMAESVAPEIGAASSAAYNRKRPETPPPQAP